MAPSLAERAPVCIRHTALQPQEANGLTIEVPVPESAFQSAVSQGLETLSSHILAAHAEALDALSAPGLPKYTKLSESSSAPFSWIASEPQHRREVLQRKEARTCTREVKPRRTSAYERPLEMRAVPSGEMGEGSTPVNAMRKLLKVRDVLRPLLSHDEFSQAESRWSILTQGILRQVERAGHTDEMDWEVHHIWKIREGSLGDTSVLHVGQRPKFLLARAFSVMASTNPEDEALKLGDVMTDGCCEKFTVHPGSAKRLIWGLLGAVLVFSDFITIPFTYSFNVAEGPGLKAWSTFKSVYWAIDLCVNFLVGFYYKGVVEMRCQGIARAYLKTWFIPDLFVLFLDIFVFTVEELQKEAPADSAASRTFRWGRAVRMLRVLRIVRLHKVAEIIKVGFDDIRSEYLVIITKILQQIISFLILNHYVACGWFGVSNFIDKGETWVDFYNIRQKDVIDQYAISYHWSLAQFTLTPHTVMPVHVLEQGFACAVGMLGFLCFCAYVSSFTNAVGQLWMIGLGRWRERLDVRNFISSRKISMALGNRIIHFFNTSYGAERRLDEYEIDFLAAMPAVLIVRLHKEMYWPILVTSPVLYNISSLERRFCIKLCHLALMERFRMPQEEIFLPGEEAEDCRFLSAGTTSYLCQKTEMTDIIDAGLEDDDSRWISQMALWVKWQHSGVLLTDTPCEMVDLNCEKVRSLVGTHGGATHTYLSRYAAFFVGHLQSEPDKWSINDLYPTAEDGRRLAKRAHDTWVRYQAAILRTESGVSSVSAMSATPSTSTSFSATSTDKSTATH